MTEKTFSSFKDIPCTPKQHFVMHLLAAICQIVGMMHHMDNSEDKKLGDIFEKYPFLGGYFGEIVSLMPDSLTWEKASVWWEVQIKLWEQPQRKSLPLCRLSENGKVSFNGRLAIMLVGLVEEDSRFGNLFAELQSPLSLRRPTLELIGFILFNDVHDSWQICRPLLQQQLLAVDNQTMPRSEWTLRVPSILWDGIRGDQLSHFSKHIRYKAPETLPVLSDLILPDAFRQQLSQLPSLLETGKTNTIILRGSHGSDGQYIMGAIARLLNRGMLVIKHTAIKPDKHFESLPIGALSRLTEALPVVNIEVGPGETAVLPHWPDYDGPLGILLGLAGGIEEGWMSTAVSLTIPDTQFEYRQQQWLRALNGTPVENLDLISERYHLPNGHIRKIAALANVQATLESSDEIRIHHVQAACRQLNRQHLDTLATRLEGGGSWTHLAANKTTMDDLYEVESRCRHREQLLNHLGAAFDNSKNRGVRVLFSGSSGTGKTLSARIIAAELEKDIYRVDLAAVINKYIGETEKNLHRVLSEAEALDVILLIDEGDALMGNRTEVRSANDRYANLETDYLLQRLEQYQGIIFITTNTAENIDIAFQRRMDVVVHFLPPEAHERWQIWQLHLPSGHQIAPAYLEEVAVRCEMTGGQIRNAALHAALLALDDGEKIMTNYHLHSAIQREYRKAGMINPMLNGHAQIAANGMDAFLSTFTKS